MQGVPTYATDFEIITVAKASKYALRSPIVKVRLQDAGRCGIAIVSFLNMRQQPTVVRYIPEFPNLVDEDASRKTVS